MIRPAALALVLAALAAPAAADTLLESYLTFIGPADLVNSEGERLRTAAGVLRQDRANMHRFRRSDPGDQADRYFSTAENRGKMERMLLTGGIAPGDAERIVAGGVFVEVQLWGTGTTGQSLVVLLR